jgi:hypothetical protein
MRDTNEDMIELIDAYNNDNITSCVIKHKICGEDLKLRFGIDYADYGQLKTILQFRPFENTGVAKYRYFFPLTYSKDPFDENLAQTAIRVEQLDIHKQFEFTVSRKFLSHILWFFEVTDKKLIESMIEE